MDASKEYNSLSEEEKHFLNLIAQDVAILVSASDKYVSSATRKKHFQKKLTEFAEKWESFNVAYKAHCKAKWLPSMGQPINPLGAIWPYVYGCRWEDAIGARSSVGGHSLLAVPKGMTLLGDYSLLGVIHDKVLPHCPLIAKGILPDKLTNQIWHDLITGVDIEGMTITLPLPRALIRKDQIRGSLSNVKADIEMISKKVQAANASGLESTGIILPKKASVIVAQEQKPSEAEQNKPQEKDGQDKTNVVDSSKVTTDNDSKDFLLNIAQKVDTLDAQPVNMKRFKEQVRAFFTELQRAESQLKDKLKSKKKSRPENLEVPYYDVLLSLLSLPCTLAAEELTEFASGPEKIKIPQETKLQADYTKLAIIHDKRSKGSTTPKINDNIWPQNDSRIEDIWNEYKNKGTYGEGKSDIESTFERVKADLITSQKNIARDDNWHNDDFTQVIWNGKEYEFDRLQQALAIKYLWENKRAREKSIGEAIGSEADNFRLIHVFRQTGKKKKMHPA